MSVSGRLPGRIRDLRIEASRLDGLAQDAHDLASELYGRSKPANAQEAQRRAIELDQTALDLRLHASELEAALAHAGLVEAVTTLLAGA